MNGARSKSSVSIEIESNASKASSSVRENVLEPDIGSDNICNRAVKDD